MKHPNCEHIYNLGEAQRHISTATQCLARDDDGYLLGVIRDHLSQAIAAIQNVRDPDIQIARTDI
ncbi:hypothetical protein [Amantichitinum ursilacus]|uniref:Uncharacterized protein n=1 Tax=Amantichitinum ursilacus TaxID=857265 RepID=A0A0N0GNY2_9NEIS|nr:hypothetical protein [Amantichitinum ursilacus]KPC53003.1 hypothetical protein WG78_10950 [Amantichitinum ursilacus]